MVGVTTNESEHRRGLVLGLTLAEVLLLLLFLILLALGARLIKDEKNLKAVSSFLIELQKSGGGTADSQKLIDELAKAKQLEKRTAELTEENARIKSELANVTQTAKALDKVVSTANSIDPNDSPAILKLAKDALEALGRSVDAQKIKILSDIGSILDRSSKSDREKVASSLKSFIASGGETPGHTWPPIIRLSDADGYFFEVGSAQLTVTFDQQIHDKIVPQLQKIAREFNVDVIEVVGHTDEQSISPRPSNLDKELLRVLRGEAEIITLVPADNAGLGITRAVAIVETLKRDERLKGFRILPFSGAQLIQTDETLSTGALAGNIRERRRIEIRMRKSN